MKKNALLKVFLVLAMLAMPTLAFSKENKSKSSDKSNQDKSKKNKDADKETASEDKKSDKSNKDKSDTSEQKKADLEERIDLILKAGMERGVM
jgi:cell division protein FtsB